MSSARTGPAASGSPLRSAARVALNRPRVLGVVALALSFELLARVAVGLLASPIAALLVPPVLGVPLLAASFPAARSAVAGDDPDWAAVPSTLRARAPSLLAFAVVGHLVALAVGAGLFLVCDTALRLPLYALVGEHLPPGLFAYLPLFGVAPATLVAWALLPPFVLPVLDGRGLRAGFRTALVDAVESPRRTAARLGLHAVAVAVTAGATFTGLVYVADVRATGPLVVGAGGLGLLAGAVTLHVAYAAHAAWSAASAPPAPLSSSLASAMPIRRPVPVARLAVAALVCSSLLVGASAIRLTETRPMDAASDPLPDDPTAAYAVAIGNTERTNHAFTARTDFVGENRSTALRIAVDRRDRRFASRFVDSHEDDAPKRTTMYRNSGVDAAATDGDRSLVADTSAEFYRMSAEPGYWTAMNYYALGGGNSFSLPAPDTGEWTVANRSDGRVTLLLNDDEAAYEALYGYAPTPDSSRGVEGAEIRMVLDTDRGVVAGGTAFVHAVATNESGSVTSEWKSELRYDVTVGGTVERPVGLGSPSLGEWAWRLFAY